VSWPITGLTVWTEIAVRMAQTKGRQMVKLMDEWKFKNLGMRSFTVECHYREDGKIVWATYMN